MTESKDIKKPFEIAKEAFDNSEPIKISDQKEPWSEYDLNDGAKLRIKPVVIEVRKSSMKDLNGNYIYHIKSSIIIDVQQPNFKTKKDS